MRMSHKESHEGNQFGFILRAFAYLLCILAIALHRSTYPSQWSPFIVGTFQALLNPTPSFVIGLSLACSLGIHLRLVGVRPAVEDRSTDGIACVVRSPCVAPPSPSNRRGPYRDLPFQRSFRSLDESSAYVEVPRIHPFPPGIGSVVGHVVVFDRDGMTGVGFARSLPSGLYPRWMGVHVTPPFVRPQWVSTRTTRKRHNRQGRKDDPRARATRRKERRTDRGRE